MSKYKLIFFGGSFNPVHNGHVRLALSAKKFICADKLIVVPTNISPHKDGNCVKALHRFNMCKIAFSDFSNVDVSDLEIKRGSVSYTIDSLHQIKKIYSNAEIFLLVGSDTFFNISSWKDANEIFKSVSICVACRNICEHEKVVSYSKLLQSIGVTVLVMNFSPFEISSSDIRRKIRNNGEIQDLVPDGVLKYISENKLYI